VLSNKSRGLTVKDRLLTNKSRGLTVKDRLLTNKSRGLTVKDRLLTNKSRGLTVSINPIGIFIRRMQIKSVDLDRLNRLQTELIASNFYQLDMFLEIYSCEYASNFINLICFGYLSTLICFQFLST